ncbi:MAG: nodulation protein NfeD [Anaerolineaceae bacterium]|nr:nodulation protein NfeD [Anaerolineaceae bacterium]
MSKFIRMIGLGWICALVLSGLMNISVNAQDTEEPVVVVLTSQEAVTPILLEYLERALRVAESESADLVIWQLDTPGGAVDTTTKIIQALQNSPIPIVVYVTPRNAMAASAGTLITLAGHVSAMAPGTTIGAASPVGGQGEDIEETMESKVKEILKASVRTLAENRNPEAIALAEDTIENAVAVTSSEALEIGLIDLQADDLDDLLDQLFGRPVEVLGEEIILNTRSARVIEVQKTFIEELLAFLINPNVAFLLLAIGVQAIFIELSNPGGWFAGFLGVICLLLAIYGMGILPVNWFGLIFILIAFVLYILEIKAATHGALALAGTAAFITGGLVLFNSVQLPGFPKVSVPLVVGASIVISSTFFVAVTFAVRAQKSPLRIGRETLPGKTGWTKTKLDPKGIVQIGGESWAARAILEDIPIEKNEQIEVIKSEGLTLLVRRKVDR